MLGLTMLQVLNASQAIPAVTAKLLLDGSISDAMRFAEMAQAFQMQRENMAFVQGALLNAYGVMDKDTRQRVPSYTSDDFEVYREKMQELLGEVHTFDIDPPPITDALLGELDEETFRYIIPVVERIET